MTDKRATSPHNDAHQLLRDYIARNGLKTSKQREVIVEVFFGTQRHVSIEELLDRVRLQHPHIGQATVYRTMKLLTQCGLAESRQFGDGHTRYEVRNAQEEHHDHLICTACGTIVEFVNTQIEALQARVAKSHGFMVSHHKMELYGLCPNCRQ